MKTKLTCIAIMISLLGCNEVDTKEKVIGNYYLIAADLPEDMSLTYHSAEDKSNYSTIVRATIFAVWHNNEYIIVKQHPRINLSPPDLKKTNYFILPIKEKMNYNNFNGLIGPIDQNSFEDTCKKLKIPPNIEFKSTLK
jgi:hypothetical protein